MEKPRIRWIAITLTTVLLVIFLILGAISYVDRVIHVTRTRFFCTDIQKGMTKEEVQRVIANYGTYTWQDDTIVGLSYVYFKEFVAMNVLGSPVVLRFDNHNRLVSISGRYKLGDELQSSCN